MGSIRIEGPKGLLDTIPGICGFIPTDSTIVVTTNERNEVLSSCRIDADAMGEGGYLAVWTDLRAQGAVSAFVVIASDDESIRDSIAPFVAMVNLVLSVKDVLVVSHGAAGSIYCQSDCCPFDYEWPLVPMVGDRVVLPSRAALEEALAHREDVDPVVMPLDDLLGMLLTDDPRDFGLSGVDVDVMAGAFEVTCESIHDRDMLLAHVGASERLPQSWVLESIAQRVNTAQAVTTLACLAYMVGDGTATNILLERVAGLGGTSMADLLSEVNARGLEPRRVRELFASIL